MACMVHAHELFPIFISTVVHVYLLKWIKEKRPLVLRILRGASKARNAVLLRPAYMRQAGRHYSQVASKWTSTWRFHHPLLALLSLTLSLRAHDHHLLYPLSFPSPKLQLPPPPPSLHLQAVVCENAN